MLHAHYKPRYLVTYTVGSCAGCQSSRFVEVYCHCVADLRGRFVCAVDLCGGFVRWICAAVLCGGFVRRICLFVRQICAADLRFARPICAATLAPPTTQAPGPPPVQLTRSLREAYPPSAPVYRSHRECQQHRLRSGNHPTSVVEDEPSVPTCAVCVPRLA